MAQDGAMLGIGDGLDDGRLVGTGVGLRVGPAVGAALVVNDVGCFVGAKVGVLVGAVVGADRVGNRLRIAVGPAEGSADGPMVGLDAVGPQVGASVGANVVGDTVGDDDAGGCVGTLLGSDVDGDEVGGRVQPKQVNRQLALKIGLVWQREGPSPSWGTLRWHSRPSLGAISTGIAVCSAHRGSPQSEAAQPAAGGSIALALQSTHAAAVTSNARQVGSPAQAALQPSGRRA